MSWPTAELSTDIHPHPHPQLAHCSAVNKHTPPPPPTAAPLQCCQRTYTPTHSCPTAVLSTDIHPHPHPQLAHCCAVNGHTPPPPPTAAPLQCCQRTYTPTPTHSCPTAVLSTDIHPHPHPQLAHCCAVNNTSTPTSLTCYRLLLGNIRHGVPCVEGEKAGHFTTSH